MSRSKVSDEFKRDAVAQITGALGWMAAFRVRQDRRRAMTRKTQTEPARSLRERYDNDGFWAAGWTGPRSSN